MDPTVQVAAIGIITTLITTAGVIIAATVNNRRERSGAASGSSEATLRERILLKDEQNEGLREDNRRLQLRLDQALAALDEKTLLERHIRKELANKAGEEEIGP